jgi:hypothetical protein
VKQRALAGIAFVVAICAVPLGLEAQGPPARLSALDQETLRAVMPTINSARAAGLPTSNLERKVLEGVAKHGTPQQIVASLRSMSERLADSRVALGVGATAEEIEAAELAVRDGVPLRAITALRVARPREALIIPLGVMTDLVGSGVPADTASRLLADLAKLRVADAELVEFRRNVQSDIARGVVPSQAALTRAQATEIAMTGIRDPNAAPKARTPPPPQP